MRHGTYGIGEVSSVVVLLHNFVAESCVQGRVGALLGITSTCEGDVLDDLAEDAGVRIFPLALHLGVDSSRVNGGTAGQLCSDIVDRRDS